LAAEKINLLVNVENLWLDVSPGQKPPIRRFPYPQETIVQTSLTSVSPRQPRWLMAAALGGIAWNLFGAVQFAGSVTATADSLLASGLNAEQAAVMSSYPAWMTFAFAIGVAGGLAGSVLLLLRHHFAKSILGASLAAYVALWIGDAVHGVFAALGAPQVIILTLVVAIAAALLAASLRPLSRG
jgi:putative effector of murein hydrolase